MDLLREKVCKTKEKGGLGVGNLVSQNKDLLSKWLRRHSREEGSLWHQVISSRYCSDVCGWLSGESGRYNLGVLRKQFEPCKMNF